MKRDFLSFDTQCLIRHGEQARIHNDKKNLEQSKVLIQFEEPCRMSEECFSHVFPYWQTVASFSYIGNLKMDATQAGKIEQNRLLAMLLGTAGAAHTHTEGRFTVFAYAWRLGSLEGDTSDCDCDIDATFVRCAVSL